MPEGGGGGLGGSWFTVNSNLPVYVIVCENLPKVYNGFCIFMCYSYKDSTKIS